MLDHNLISLLNRHKHKQVEIARIMGVSRQRIHQILKNYKTIKYTKKIKKILENRCKICQNSSQMLHHIDNNPHNNDLKNIIPVCSQCHGKLHRGRKYDRIKRYITYICQTCKKKFNRGKGSAYKGKFCSSKCYGVSIRNKSGQWSKNYSECIVCSTTQIKHVGKGMCNNCYSRHLYYKYKK